ncbi:unnamed protein product [Rotaria magnacalcarata]
MKQFITYEFQSIVHTMSNTWCYAYNGEPFTTFYFNLQEGKFDHASRTFHSIPISWQNCQWDSFDVKELIPESFSLPEMFTNCNHYKLGRVEDGIKIDDVV